MEKREKENEGRQYCISFGIPGDLESLDMAQPLVGRVAVRAARFSIEDNPFIYSFFYISTLSPSAVLIYTHNCTTGSMR